MPVIRCSEQKHGTLFDFYKDKLNADSKVDQSIGKAMLELIDFLNQNYTETTFWAFTSLYSIHLLNQDNLQSNSLIVFITNGKEFKLEYLDPEEKDNQIRIALYPKTMKEMKTYLKEAIDKTKGWL